MAQLFVSAVSLLQEINRTVAGIQSAPGNIANYPDGELQLDYAPICLAWPESGKAWTYGHVSSEYDPLPKEHRGVYTLEIYIEPVELEGSYGRAKKKCLELLDLFIQKYLGLENPVLCHGPLRVELDLSETGGITHKGVGSVLMYTEDVFWYGLELQIPVIESWDAAGGDCEGC